MIHDRRSHTTIVHAFMLIGVACCAVPAIPAAASEAVFIYATRSDRQLHFVKASDLSPLNSVDIQLGAHELAVSGDGRWAIGSAYGGPGAGHQPADQRLAIIDCAKRAVHRIVDLQLERPNDIAFLPDHTHAIVTVENPPRLIKINASSGEFSTITLNHGANHMMALHPDGKVAYVAHVMPGIVSVVDLATGTTTATIDTAVGAEGIACSPDGKQVWVACNRADTICVIDTASNSVKHTIIAKGFPFRVRFSPDGSKVAVSFPAASEVRVFDAADHTKVQRITLRKTDQPDVPVQGTSIAFSPDGAALAVICDGKSPELVLINLAQGEVTHRITTAAIPDALAAGRM